jgi:hypothetical protein
VTSNNEEKTAVYKFSLDFNLIKFVVSPVNHHIGDPPLWNGKICVSVDPPNENDNARVWVLDTELSSGVIFDLGNNSKRDPPGKIPWCAINPCYLYLYISVSSTSDDIVDIRGYSVPNGKFLGSFRLDYGNGDDIESIYLSHTSNSTGISFFVYVIILDNEGTKDEVFINHFSVSDPSVL